MDKVPVIVLNYNSLHSLGYCLAAIKQNTENYELVIIDNASTDSSLAWLKLKKDKLGFRLIENSENQLFTKPYADYAKTVKSKYFVIMNNDCVPEPNWLKELINYMEKNPECGIAAPMLVGIDGRQVANMGGLQDFCSHKSGTREMYKDPEKNWWTTFACALIRTEAYKKVGGLDEHFLFYCSDSDLCLRMILNDYTVYNIPTSVVRHFHSQSTKDLNSETRKQIMQIGQNDQRLFNLKWAINGCAIGGKYFPVVALEI